MHRRIPALLGLLFAIVATVAAPAGAVTFGADLSAFTANSRATCRAVLMPGVGYVGNMNGQGLSASSCTVYNIGPMPTGNTLSVAGSTVVPMTPAQTGTITEVRIKTGAMNGVSSAAARLDILATSSHVGGGDVACCTGTATTQTITLRPNTTLTVATNLPVATPLSPDATMYTGQILALTMLDPTVPLPAAELPFNGYGASFFGNMVFPAVSAGQERFNPFEQTGLVNTELLISADVTITGSAGGTGGTAAPGGVAKVAKGKAAVPLVCPAGGNCSGTLVLASGRLAGATEMAATTKAKLTRYGSAGFKVAAGTTGKVSVALSKSGRALLAKAKAATVWANVTTTGGTTKATRLRITR